MSKYKITAPVTVTGPGWGLAFVNGVAETDNEALAKKLASKGYNVETEAPAAAFVCPVCGKGYQSESGLKSHLKKEHPDFKPEEPPTPGQNGDTDKDPDKDPDKGTGQGQE